MLKVILIIVAIIIVAAIVLMRYFQKTVNIEHEGAKITLKYLHHDWNTNFKIHIYLPKDYTYQDGLTDKIRMNFMSDMNFGIGLWIRILLLKAYAGVNESDIEVNGFHKKVFSEIDGFNEILEEMSKHINSSSNYKLIEDATEMIRARRQKV